MAPSPSIHLDGTAVVIGASMAGLLAARMLAEHYGRVTILEKDTFPPAGENRKSVPQGRHIHVLLDRGRRIIERKLPGLTQALVDAGACDLDASRDLRWYHEGFHARGESDVRGIGVGRPMLEAAVRTRVLERANVEALEDCRVTGLVSDVGRRRVTGVRCTRPAKDGPEETLDADLVVDAMGRGSRSPAWLGALGYEAPEVEEVEVGVGYTTCRYRRRADDLDGLKGIVLLAVPPDKRLGVMIGMEGPCWLVTLGGYLGHHAPTDYAGFVDFARTLPTPHIHDVIRDAEPLTDPAPYRFPVSRRHHYERLSRFPEGYLVLGDALCSFNPVYAQGMTVAALEAEALDACLGDGRDGLTRRFFRRARKIVDLPWSTAVGTDLRFPEVRGRRTPMIRFVNWYLPKLHAAAQRDHELSVAFLKVINMMSPPPSILRPGVVWRVLWGGVGKEARA